MHLQYAKFYEVRRARLAGAAHLVGTPSDGARKRPPLPHGAVLGDHGPLVRISKTKCPRLASDLQGCQATLPLIWRVMLWFVCFFVTLLEVSCTLYYYTQTHLEVMYFFITQSHLGCNTCNVMIPCDII